jgi:hypothetical protein
MTYLDNYTDYCIFISICCSMGVSCTLANTCNALLHFYIIPTMVECINYYRCNDIYCPFNHNCGYNEYAEYVFQYIRYYRQNIYIEKLITTGEISSLPEFLMCTRDKLRLQMISQDDTKCFVNFRDQSVLCHYYPDNNTYINAIKHLTCVPMIEPEIETISYIKKVNNTTTNKYYISFTKKDTNYVYNESKIRKGKKSKNSKKRIDRSRLKPRRHKMSQHQLNYETELYDREKMDLEWNFKNTNPPRRPRYIYKILTEKCKCICSDYKYGLASVPCNNNKILIYTIDHNNKLSESYISCSKRLYKNHYKNHYSDDYTYETIHIDGIIFKYIKLIYY